MSMKSDPSDFELPLGVERRWHVLPDGARMEVLCSKAVPAAPPPPSLPPLLFVHGASHGAWCWAEHFLRFFAAAGFDCHAISLRGHGGSDAGPPGTPPGSATRTLQSYCDDLQSFITTFTQPPVLIVHSFGGLVAAKYVGQLEEGSRPPLAGLALLSSGPPRGMSARLWCLLKKSPWRLAKILWLQATGVKNWSPAACRFLFFSAALPEEDLERYRAKLAAGPSLPPISPWALSAHENAVRPAPPAGGWQQLAPARVLVGCGSEDVLVDEEMAKALGEYFGGAAVVAWERVGHDAMLDVRWQEVATSLLEWLNHLPLLG